MENLPKRKPNRLSHFDYSTSGAYFLTICTQGTHNLSIIEVSTTDDGIPQTKLTDLGRIVEKHLLSSEKIDGVKLYRYVIMPDHIHAIVVFDSDKFNKNGTSKAPSPTNQMLPHVISTFKRFVNKEVGTNIFQRGYMEHIIRDRDDLETRMNYIFENPIRWYYKNKK